MIPLSIQDVVEGIATAQYLFKTGFRKANNANQKYREFGEDIRSLAINLSLLSQVVRRAEQQAGSLKRASRSTKPGSGANAASVQVLGNFKETLNECQSLLSDETYFQKSDEFVSNVSWYHQIDPEVQKLREKIAFHNIKLSICFNTLDAKILEDRFLLIVDSTDAILNAAEQLGQQVRGDDGRKDHLPIVTTESVGIPPELEGSFIALTQQVYPDLSIIPLDVGLDAAVFYFNRVTKTPEQLQQSEIRYLVTIIDIMKAAWILRTVKATHDYQIIANHAPLDEFEEQIDRWGMTVERFFAKFDAELCEAMRRLLGRHLLPPPTPDLLEIFEKERQIWPGYTEPAPMKETELAEFGSKILFANLGCANPGYTQTMQLFRQTEKRFNLLLVKASGGREKETTDGFDLEKVQIVPSYAKRTWTTLALDPQTMVFKTDDMSPVSRTLAFYQTKDMFEFQYAVTGYKVIHDDTRVLTTSYESKLLGGTRRQDLCRLQLWLAPPPNIDIQTSTKGPYSSPSSTPPDSRRASQTSFTSSKFARRKSSASALSMFSSGMRSSSSSRSSVVNDPPSLPNFDSSAGASSTKVAIYSAPVLPCIVLFAHKAPAHDGEREETLRSFLVVDINTDVTIEHELSESDDTHSQSYSCVIERKGSYLPARRSPETSDASRWDLAAAGMHKRLTGTEVLKKLKHVIIQFDAHTNLQQFMTKFSQAKDLAKLRLAQYVQATG